MVRRWSLTGYFPILYNPQPRAVAGSHTMNAGCKDTPVTVVHEHDGVGSVPPKQLRVGEEELVGCLKLLRNCTPAVRDKARALGR
jgi:hypothetical protein